MKMNINRMWRLGRPQAATHNFSEEEFLHWMNPELEYVEPIACTSEEAPSVGMFRSTIHLFMWIWRYFFKLLYKLTTFLYLHLRMGLLATWEYLCETYQSIDFVQIRATLYAKLHWLQHELYNIYLWTHSIMQLQHELWVDHHSTKWLHEKTGIPAEDIVAMLATSLALVLGGGFYKFVWKRPRRKRRKQRARSLSFTYGERTRGARDRGFSLDLSPQPPNPPKNGIAGNYFSFDFFRKTGAKENPSTNRTRSSSHDLFNQSMGIGDDLTNPNHAIGLGVEGAARPTTAKILPLLTFHGPTETCLYYNTWTPPPSWTEASRSLLPTDTRIKLQREIVLDLSKDKFMIAIREPSSRRSPPLTLPVDDCSIHVKTPLIAGVLEIYVKDSSKEEWMEHTFDTAKNAAQFQIDMLAIQLFGPALNRMYQAMVLIHQGSMACEGREYVCHHDSMSDEFPQGVGVAWDDAMRALGAHVPSLRVALERLWWHHYSMNNLKLRARNRAKNQKKGGKKGSASSVGNGPSAFMADGDELADGTNGANTDANKKDSMPAKNQDEYIHLTADYVRRRLLLGPVDFFRLFAPALPDTALPSNESSKRRMVQLLRWRKRVATSAILVQAYFKARIVANKGWVLARPLPTHYLTRRLSFDDNIDNSQRDASTKNEYYEATVSRDVLTFVRADEPDAFKPKEHWWEYCCPRRLRTAISKYQAFTLVGTHVFRIPQDDDFPLHPTKDPVLTFGSLRTLVETNPDLDFFVVSFFPKSAQVCYVNVFVRSLPKGVDSAFDRNMSRFKHGSKEIRDKKLSLMLQLGSSETKTWTEVAAITGMTYLLRTIAGDLDTSTPNTDMGPSDRMPFPLIPLNRFGETHHFGGALQEDRKLPQNYCSATVLLDASQTRFHMFARLLMSMIERGFMAKNVYDVTYVLAANEQDELPERALATVRLARVAAADIALPSAFVYGSRRGEVRRRNTWEASNFKSVLGNFSMGGERLRALQHFDIDDDDASHTSTRKSLTSDSQRSQRKLKKVETILESRKANKVKTLDPIELAVNELVDILCNIKVPVRRDQLPLHDFAMAVPLSLLEAYSTKDGTLHNKELLNLSLLLLITRGEIRRHYVASGCNLKKACVRIVETTAWRGLTFPIDQRMCRIELQSGQFFHQGFDHGGRPVFYFRNMGLGPWRKDHDASVAAVLHRLEGALWELSRFDDSVKCTLIVIMGKPYKEISKKKGSSDAASTIVEEADEDGESMMSGSIKEADEDSPDGQRIANPRVNPDESWQVQTSKKMIRQLITLVSAHYPERLHQALVVLKPSQSISLRKIFGSFTLPSFVESPVTRSKVKILSSFSELPKYVSKQELVSIAGGERPINPEVFGVQDV